MIEYNIGDVDVIIEVIMDKEYREYQFTNIEKLNRELTTSLKRTHIYPIKNYTLFPNLLKDAE